MPDKNYPKTGDERDPLITGLPEDEGRYSESTRNARAQRQLKDFRDKAAEARWAQSQSRGSEWAKNQSLADTANKQEAAAEDFAKKTSSETGYNKGGMVSMKGGGSVRGAGVAQRGQGKMRMF
jgi:hypothetical protein